MGFRDVTLINVALIDKPLCVMNYMYADVTEKIIGASMKIHRYLGNGFQEVIYQRCLEIELKNLRLNFEREKNQNIFLQRDCRRYQASGFSSWKKKFWLN